MKNEYSQVIPKEVLDLVNTKLQECHTALKPFCVEFTPDQREEMPKLGIRNTGKISSIANEMIVAPEYTPPMFSMDEVNKDSKVISDLSPVATKITNLQMMVNDTLMLAGSEVFLAYMDYYSTVKHFASRNDPKAKAIYERLKPMFTPNVQAVKKARASAKPTE